MKRISVELQRQLESNINAHKNIRFLSRDREYNQKNT